MKIVPLGGRVIDSEFPALDIIDVVAGELPLPLLLSVGELAVVILRVDDDAGLVIVKVGDYVAPPLVVVDSHSDDEVLAGVGNETKSAGCSTATHGEHLLAVHFGPSSSIGIVPDGLLNDLEEGVGVGLVDADGNFVAHSGLGMIKLDSRSKSVGYVVLSANASESWGDIPTCGILLYL